MMDATTTFFGLMIGSAAFLGTLGIEAVTPKGPTQASLKTLTLADGYFVQEHFVTGSGALEMTWAAEITRGMDQLCSGGGVAPYADQIPKRFSPDDWTGDDCPILQAGDFGFATWTYLDETGTRVTVQGQLKITAEMLAEVER